jgi:arsenate reductase (thioredoxin)
MLTKKILFVCVKNLNRSQMAEAFARIHGDPKIEAMSAGSRSSGIVNPKAIKEMSELGYNLGKQRVKLYPKYP